MLHGLELPIQAQDLINLTKHQHIFRHLSLHNRWKITIWQ